ncbi:MAG: hypothetical protein ACR2MY_14255 [Candidatus Dormibacteria bacterium]
MSKHLVDIDDEILGNARARLGTASIKETVNEALRRASEIETERMVKALDTLGGVHLEDRGLAWR